MSQGTVKWFNEQKGFGFITSNDGKDYFVHHTNIMGSGFKTLPEGAEVEFEVEKSERGFRAVQVSVI
ncbi:MAG: cold-shock protein [Spirochaetae bacterium HGW-Spirochaetae-1]|jgi:CspA family cold shock protein|nr:MAG: cold-shock protein [Spirochaetae bacterium HGW-Spirochaetae-1]